MKIELREYGVEDALSEIRFCLKDAVGSKVSKKRKDEVICQAFGVIDALVNVLLISCDDVEDDNSEPPKGE